MNDTTAFSARRLHLADLLPGIPVLLTSGCQRYKNYLGNPYPFRANSHYMYFGAPSDPDTALLLLNGEATLYRQPETDEDRLWHGGGSNESDLIESYELAAVKGLDQLCEDLATLGVDEVLSVPQADLASNKFLERFLGRLPNLQEDPDVDLVDALIECRLRHDEQAVRRLREAVGETVRLQRTIALACRDGISETALKAAHDHFLALHGYGPSFQPILTVRGEVLHNHSYSGTLKDGDLVLLDCGVELADGWSGDLTRTLPVSGRFSEAQRGIYEVVDRARQVAVEKVAPGVHFRDLHFAAAEAMVDGLLQLGIFKGTRDQLLERRAHTLFFPHGLGHLLGLDAHDMEDLGDAAGYAEGEERSSHFGTDALRLSRELEAGMVVTIEPGFYAIPALLDGELGRSFDDVLDRQVLARYTDVRGIRIEDDVLVTEDGFEVLSSDLPTKAEQVEGLVLCQA